MKWTKPSGAKCETNDFPATIKAAKSLGWKNNPKQKLPGGGSAPKQKLPSKGHAPKQKLNK